MLPDRRRMPEGLVRFLFNARYFILIGFIAIVGICGYWASRFTNDCSQETIPPAGSQAAEAAEIYRQYFGGTDLTGFLVYIKSTTPAVPTPATVPPQPAKLIDMATDEQFNHFDFHVEYWCKTGQYLSAEYIATHPGDSFYTLQYNQTTLSGTYSSYRAVLAANLTLLAARQYISPGNNSVSVTVTYDKGSEDAETTEWAKELDKSITKLLAMHNLTDHVEAYIVSMPTFMDEIGSAVLGDLYRMFTSVIPIALIIFGVSLSSGKLLILPISVLVTALFITAAIMDGIAQSYMAVNSMSPGVMVMVLIAFTFDYTYFIASQWRREMVHLIEAGTCHADEVDLLELMKSLYATAGKTIFISCHTIVLCSVGISFFSTDLIKSMGITIVVAAEVTGIVALLLPVALLVSFPSFFFATLEKWCNAIQPEDCVTIDRAIGLSNENAGERTYPSTSGGSRESPSPRHGDGEKSLLAASTPTNNYGGGEQSDAEWHQNHQSKARGRSVMIAVAKDDEAHDHHHAASATNRGSSRNSRRVSMVDATRHAAEVVLQRETAKDQVKEHNQWAFIFQFAEFITGYPQRIVFVIFAVALLTIMIPFAMSPAYSNSINQYVPRFSPVLPGWKGLQTDFQAGSLFTYSLVIDYTGQDSDYSLLFKKQQDVVWAMIKELPDTYPRNFAGAAFSGIMASSLASGGNISFDTIVNCNMNAAFGITTPECNLFLLSMNIFEPSVEGAPFSYIQIALDWDPLEGVGKEWYNKAVALLDRLEGETGFKLYLTGYAAETFDTIAYAEDAFTIIIIVTVAVLFCCMFLAFGSIVIALVVLSSVTLTVLSAFGMLTLTYRYGGFDWVGWSGVSGNGAISWQIPFTSFLASAAVALNYEIIYVTKVFEMRWKGFDTHTSIVLSVTATMREVSVGAAMMVITFVGMLLSEVNAMNQMGFVFFATALAEGFVVRLFFTPPLMALLGHYNWFPLQYCPEMFTPPLVGASTAGEALEDVAYFEEEAAAAAAAAAEEEEEEENDDDYRYSASAAVGEVPSYAPRESHQRRRHTRESASGGAGFDPAPAAVRSSHLGRRPQFTREEDTAAREAIERYRHSVIHQRPATTTTTTNDGGAVRSSVRNSAISARTSALRPRQSQLNRQSYANRVVSRGGGGAEQSMRVLSSLEEPTATMAASNEASEYTYYEAGGALSSVPNSHNVRQSARDSFLHHLSGQ